MQGKKKNLNQERRRNCTRDEAEFREVCDVSSILKLRSVSLPSLSDSLVVHFMYNFSEEKRAVKFSKISYSAKRCTF